MKEKKIKELSLIFAVVFFVCLIGIKIWQFFVWPTTELSLKGEHLFVLVADNSEHQYKGLGDRDNLGKYNGMLFVFGKPKRAGVVMRDMRFPIDVVWLNNGEVVDIASNLQLEPGVSEENLRAYYPRMEANTFLELPAGWAVAHGLKIGDKLEVVE